MPPRRRNNKKGSITAPRGAGNVVGGFKEATTSLSRVSEGYIPLFPPRTHKVLRYHDNVTVASTTGAVNSYVFTANDLFDPDVTGSGHQPMGFDQMMVFYNHFAVDKCRIIVNASNTASTSFHAGVRVDASNTPLTSANQIVEFGGVTYDVLEAKSSYGSSKTFTLDVDIAKIQGIPRKNITTDPNLRGDASNSPSEKTYFHLFCWDPTFSASGSVNFDVIMEFGSWFMEPRDATLSLKAKPPNPVVAEQKTQEAGWCLFPKK